MPLRTSSLRSLGAYANVFAIESFMDELRRAAGATRRSSSACAPERRARARGARGGGGARRVGRRRLGRAGRGAASRSRATRTPPRTRPWSCALRVDDATAAIALERIVIAADCGEVVDPSGATNQLEGGALQSASWTLKEQVDFDETAVTSVDWDTYPILRFSEVPPVETVLLDRPGEPFLGVGEATQGPTAAAIANAVFDAVGVRMRDTPFTPARVREAALDLPG